MPWNAITGRHDNRATARERWGPGIVGRVLAIADQGITSFANLVASAGRGHSGNDFDIKTSGFRRRTESYQFDLRTVTGGHGQASVARQQRRVEYLGQRDIGSVIVRQIVP